LPAFAHTQRLPRRHDSLQHKDVPELRDRIASLEATRQVSTLCTLSPTGTTAFANAHACAALKEPHAQAAALTHALGRACSNQAAFPCSFMSCTAYVPQKSQEELEEVQETAAAAEAELAVGLPPCCTAFLSFSSHLPGWHALERFSCRPADVYNVATATGLLTTLVPTVCSYLLCLHSNLQEGRRVLEALGPVSELAREIRRAPCSRSWPLLNPFSP
jgi:hypothetical protein